MYCIVVFSTILMDVYAIHVTNVHTVLFMNSCYIDVFISIHTHVFPSQMQHYIILPYFSVAVCFSHIQIKFIRINIKITTVSSISKYTLS
jgi:hypothetical protein